MTEQREILQITLLDVRASYFNGFQKGDFGNYSTHGIFGKDHPQVPALIKLIKAACAQGWPQQAEAMYESIKAKDMLPLHIGNISKPGKDGYKDMLFVTANTSQRPTLVETRGGTNVPLVEADGRPYSGCQINLMIQVYPQLAGKNKDGSPKPARVNAQWMGAQFLRHGTAFGGGRVARPDEFGIVATDADATPAVAAGVDDFM